MIAKTPQALSRDSRVSPSPEDAEKHEKSKVAIAQSLVSIDAALSHFDGKEKDLLKTQKAKLEQDLANLVQQKHDEDVKG